LSLCVFWRGEAVHLANASLASVFINPPPEMKWPGGFFLWQWVISLSSEGHNFRGEELKT
jgi:hypothetical protein